MLYFYLSRSRPFIGGDLHPGRVERTYDAGWILICICEVCVCMFWDQGNLRHDVEFLESERDKETDFIRTARRKEKGANQHILYRIQFQFCWLWCTQTTTSPWYIQLALWDIEMKTRYRTGSWFLPNHNSGILGIACPTSHQNASWNILRFLFLSRYQIQRLSETGPWRRLTCIHTGGEPHGKPPRIVKQEPINWPTATVRDSRQGE